MQQTVNMLILGSHNRHMVVEAVSRLGFTPKVYGSALSCLDHLRKSQVTAILVDRDFTHADALEFILNVRDINHEVFVVVVGKPNNPRIDDTIKNHERVALLGRPDDTKTLLRKMTPLFKQIATRAH